MDSKEKASQPGGRRNQQGEGELGHGDGPPSSPSPPSTTSAPTPTLSTVFLPSSPPRSLSSPFHASCSPSSGLSDRYWVVKPLSGYLKPSVEAKATVARRILPPLLGKAYFSLRRSPLYLLLGVGGALTVGVVAFLLLLESRERTDQESESFSSLGYSGALALILYFFTFLLELHWELFCLLFRQWEIYFYLFQTLPALTLFVYHFVSQDNWAIALLSISGLIVCMLTPLNLDAMPQSGLSKTLLRFTVMALSIVGVVLARVSYILYFDPFPGMEKTALTMFRVPIRPWLVAADSTVLLVLMNCQQLLIYWGKLRRPGARGSASFVNLKSPLMVERLGFEDWKDKDGPSDRMRELGIVEEKQEEKHGAKPREGQVLTTDIEKKKKGAAAAAPDFVELPGSTSLSSRGKETTGTLQSYKVISQDLQGSQEKQFLPLPSALQCLGDLPERRRERDGPRSEKDLSPTGGRMLRTGATEVKVIRRKKETGVRIYRLRPLQEPLYIDTHEDTLLFLMNKLHKSIGSRSQITQTIITPVLSPRKPTLSMSTEGRRERDWEWWITFIIGRESALFIFSLLTLLLQIIMLMAAKSERELETERQGGFSLLWLVLPVLFCGSSNCFLLLRCHPSLLRKVLRSFDFGLLLLNLVEFLVCCCFLLHWDIRCLVPASLVLTVMVVLIGQDAILMLPSRRRLYLLSVFTCLLVSEILLGVYLVYLPSEGMTFFGGALSVFSRSPLSLALDALLTVIAYTLRSLLSIARQPEVLVMALSRIEYTVGQLAPSDQPVLTRADTTHIAFGH